MNQLKSFLLFIVINFTAACNLACAEEATVRASQFVDANAKKVLNILEHSDKSSKKQNLIALFLEVTDYEWMAKFVIGRQWSQLSPTQQQQYSEAYKNYLISIYVPKYTDYNKQTYNIYASVPLKNDQYQVSMNIDSKNSKEAIKVEYRLKAYGDTFKIRDIVAEGISLLATQRADFSSFLSNHPIESLIENLEAKTKY